MIHWPAVAFTLLFVAIVPPSASAAPIPIAPAIAEVDSGLVLQVHGRHRACVRGYVPRWGRTFRHRHYSSYRAEPCGRRYEDRPRDYRRRGCFLLGPVWVCP